MKSFQIPAITEVVQFIQEKQNGWPQTFIEYIADCFWNHYQSCGWRLSSNVAIKDWKACFNSRWNKLPYEEQRKKLQECKQAEIRIPEPKKTVWNVDKTGIYIDDLLSQFKTGKYNWKDLAIPYKWLKGEGLIRFTQAEVEKLVMDAGNDKEYGRYLSVKLFFTKLISEGKTFAEFYDNDRGKHLAGRATG